MQGGRKMKMTKTTGRMLWLSYSKKDPETDEVFPVNSSGFKMQIFALCTLWAIGSVLCMAVAANETNTHVGLWYLNKDLTAQARLENHRLTLTISNLGARVAYVRSTLFDTTCLKDNILSIRFADQSILGGFSSQYKLFSTGILGMGSNGYPVRWLALQPKEARSVEVDLLAALRAVNNEYIQNQVAHDEFSYVLFISMGPFEFLAYPETPATFKGKKTGVLIYATPWMHYQR